jgi:hypothetical protein
MWLRLPIHGLTDSENYWYDTKNSLKDNEALLHMAAAIIAFRKAGFIYE